jgi:hypothetical protein
MVDNITNDAPREPLIVEPFGQGYSFISARFGRSGGGATVTRSRRTIRVELPEDRDN